MSLFLTSLGKNTVYTEADYFQREETLQPQSHQPPSHADSAIALSVIRGTSVPDYRNPIGGGEHSVITDLGHSRYAPQKRTNSDPMSHDSGLRNRLMHAM